MARKKPKPDTLLLGYWYTVSITERDEDDVHGEVAPGIEFDAGTVGMTSRSAP
jgi:hypothetical protein